MCYRTCGTNYLPICMNHSIFDEEITDMAVEGKVYHSTICHFRQKSEDSPDTKLYVFQASLNTNVMSAIWQTNYKVTVWVFGKQPTVTGFH